MFFSKRSDNAPVCYTKPLDSLKIWNDHFFWVDASVFPISVPWRTNKTLRKDPPPLHTEFNADVYHYLATNPAPFRKFLEPFLCFVGISWYYTLDDSCYPTFLTANDKEMDLFAFIYHVDPTKVQIGEREVGEGEDEGIDVVNEEGGDAAVADQTEKSNHVVQFGGIDIMANDETQAIITDKPKRVRKKRKAADGASGSGLPPKTLREDHGDFGDVGASTARKFLVALEGLLDSSTLAVEVSATAATTIPFVTSSVTPTPEHEDGGHADSITGLNLSSMPPPLVLTAAVATTIITDATSALAPKAGTEPVPRSIFIDSTSTGEANQDVTDYIPKWNVTNDSALNEPSFFSAPQHGLSILSYDELSTKAASLKSEKDKLIDQVSTLEDLDAELMRMALHLDEEFYPCYLTTITVRRWILSRGLRLVVMKCLQSLGYLVALGGAIGRAIDKGMQVRLAGVDYGKARRGLADIATYDLSAKANFVFAVNALRSVDFPLLAQPAS
ncbi:hypothetical protein Tco_0304697 [Tanacetum coccineum]